MPLLKRVLALPGQTVCRIGRTITVDRIEIGDALDRDRTGRELPVWHGCRRIAGDEIFLMNADVRDSLDGRYFGPIPGQRRHRSRGAALDRRSRRRPLRLACRDALTATIPRMTLAAFTQPPARKELPMAQIGQFHAQDDGVRGRIHTLTLDREFTLVPAEPSDAENAPDYRIHHGADDGPEIGAGWKRTGEKAGEYISLLIDDPALPQPIRANLFRDDDGGAAWSLHWTRPVKRGERE